MFSGEKCDPVELPKEEPLWNYVYSPEEMSKMLKQFQKNRSSSEVLYEYKIVVMILNEDGYKDDIAKALADGWEPIREIGLSGLNAPEFTYHPSVTFVLRRPKGASDE